MTAKMDATTKALIEAGRAEVSKFVEEFAWPENEAAYGTCYDVAPIVFWSVMRCSTIPADPRPRPHRLIDCLKFVGVIDFVGFQVDKANGWPMRTSDRSDSRAHGFWFVVEHCLDLLPEHDRTSLLQMAAGLKKNYPLPGTALD